MLLSVWQTLLSIRLQYKAVPWYWPASYLKEGACLSDMADGSAISRSRENSISQKQVLKHEQEHSGIGATLLLTSWLQNPGRRLSGS